MSMFQRWFGFMLFAPVIMNASLEPRDPVVFFCKANELRKNIADRAHTDYGWQTPWEISIAKEDNPQLIGRFLNDGLSPNAQNVLDWSMLHMAVWYRRKGVVKMVLERGAHVDGEQGWPSPLYNLLVHFQQSAAEIEILGYLLDHGANVNRKNDAQRTAPIEVADPVAKAIIAFFIRHKH